MGQACCKDAEVPAAERDDLAAALRRCVLPEGEEDVPKEVHSPVDEAMPELLRSVSGNHVVVEHFPMHTVSVRTFMALAAMESFGQLRARGVVAPTCEEAVIHFISHEWLGFTHPDPDGEQLRRMQGVFRAVIEGRILDIFELDDWKAYSERVSAGSRGKFREMERRTRRQSGAFGSFAPTLTEEDFNEHVSAGEVWLDYASIPQRGDFADPEMFERVMACAVRSIPAYLERCQYFWVLTPTAKHVDKGTWCSFTTWRQRGWCRLEEWGNFLSTSSCSPLIITHSPKLKLLGYLDFIMGCQGKPFMAPCAGAFTCCRLNHQMDMPSGAKRAIACDKDFVVEVLVQLCDNKRRQLRADPLLKIAYGGFCGIIEPIIFGGAPSRMMQPESLDECLDEFMERCNLSHLTEVVKPGFSVWHFAAMFGSVSMLRKLQASPEAWAMFQGPDPLAHPALPWLTMRGSLVNTAAMQGRVKALEEMLALGVVGVPDLFAAEGSERIAPVDRAAKYGFPDMVTLLLDRRADLHCRRVDGSTPLHGAAEAGHQSSCRVLLERRADANALDNFGRSPLHLAADPVTFYGCGEGKPAVLEVLLQYRADLTLRDSSGQTALDIARAACFYEGEDVFLVSQPV